MQRAHLEVVRTVARSPWALLRSIEGKLTSELDGALDLRELQRELCDLAATTRGAWVFGSEAAFRRAFPELGALLSNLLRARAALAEKLRALADQLGRGTCSRTRWVEDTRDTLRILSANLLKEVELYYGARGRDVAA